MLDRVAAATSTFDPTAFVHAVLNDARGRLDLWDITAKAQNRSLSDLSEDAARWATRLANVTWSVEHAEGESLILGDACVVAFQDGDERPRVLFGGSETVRALFLPISSTRVLVGRRMGPPPVVDPQVLNSASAALSRNFFIGSTIEHARYMQPLGTHAALIPREELDEMKSQPIR
jgi:hypothetical protein